MINLLNVTVIDFSTSNECHCLEMVVINEFGKEFTIILNFHGDNLKSMKKLGYKSYKSFNISILKFSQKIINKKISIQVYFLNNNYFFLNLINKIVE